MENQSIKIRPAARADVGTVLTLIQELAEYQREPHAVVATEQRICDALFSPSAAAYALIAELDGKAVGMAVYFFNFSTWLGLPGLYIEDLFVRPSVRGVGIGRRLMMHLARIAVARGCARMDWAVFDWNTPAVDFYTKLGAAPINGWTAFRLTDESLAALAK